jgi:hypothetical protein
MAMTWQSLSCLAQLPSASLIAACSLAPFRAIPGRPDEPIATAFHPVVASASWRATSSRAALAQVFGKPGATESRGAGSEAEVR